MQVTLCNMCMIEDAAAGRVLVQHRLAKATNPWCGLTFPGGHVEAGESITASTVREIREETGLTVSNLRMCGVVEWETIGERTEGSPAEVTDNSKYIVFMFRTSTFTHWRTQILREGRMEWMTLDEVANQPPEFWNLRHDEGAIEVHVLPECVNLLDAVLLQPGE